MTHFVGKSGALFVDCANFGMIVNGADIRTAKMFEVWKCQNPECKNVHFVLFGDGADDPIGTAAVPLADIEVIIRKLTEVQAACRKGSGNEPGDARGAGEDSRLPICWKPLRGFALSEFLPRMERKMTYVLIGIALLLTFVAGAGIGMFCIIFAWLVDRDVEGFATFKSKTPVEKRKIEGGYGCVVPLLTEGYIRKGGRNIDPPVFERPPPPAPIRSSYAGWRQRTVLWP